MKKVSILRTALVLIVLIFAITSISFIYSSSFTDGVRRHGESTIFMTKQIVWYVLGIFVMFVVSHINFRVYEKYKNLIYIIGLIGLLVVLIFADPLNGARRWLKIFGFSIQPSEFAKLAFIIFLAGKLSYYKKKDLKDFDIIIPTFIGVSIYGGLIILQRDFSTAVHLFAIYFVMIFAADIAIKYIFGSAGLSILIGFLIVRASPYRWARIEKYIQGLKETNFAGGDQAVQSMIGIGNGGFAGVGFSQGMQKYHYLPEQYSDYIFSIIAEETGFVGSVLLLLLYMIIAGIGFYVIRKTNNYLGKQLVLGVVSLIIIQALLNIMVVTGIFPSTGIPLPMISLGGSSLMVILMSLGVMQNIIKEGKSG